MGKREAPVHISISTILIALILFVAFLILYNLSNSLVMKNSGNISNSQRQLVINLNASSAHVSPDNQTTYISLKKDEEVGNISALNFIFKDADGNTYNYIYYVEDIKYTYDQRQYESAMATGEYEFIYNIEAEDVRSQNSNFTDFSNIISVGIVFESSGRDEKPENDRTSNTAASGGGSSGGHSSSPSTTPEDPGVVFVSPTSVEGMDVTPSGNISTESYGNLSYSNDGNLSTGGYWTNPESSPSYGAIKASVNPDFYSSITIWVNVWIPRGGHGVTSSVWAYYDNSWNKLVNFTNSSSPLGFQRFPINPAKNISAVAVEFYDATYNFSRQNYVSEIKLTLVPSEPVADFVAYPSSLFNELVGDKPFILYFIDLSTNSPTGWYWDFGDGTNSTEQNPIHTYTQEGVYTVSLTTHGTNIKTRTKIKYVNVTVPPPIASFNAQNIGIAPVTINFTDTSTNYPASWYWDFGDGTNSTEQNPSHIYENVGNYNVILRVSNSRRNSTLTSSVQVIAPFSHYNYLMASHGINYSNPDCSGWGWYCSDDSLHLWGSDDGISWKLLVSPPVGRRDPSIFKNTDGKYYLAVTEFYIYTSTDLAYWRLIYAPLNFPGNRWAPEWFVDDDGSVHIFISGIYETHPLDDSFTNWSAPILLRDTNGNSLGGIDPYMVKINKTYYLWYKKTEPFTGYATSTNLTSNFTDIEPIGYMGNCSNDTDRMKGDWTGVWDAREGPSLIKMNDTTWRIYFEHTISEVEYSESSDNFATWTIPKPLIYENSGELMAAHGTVMRWPENTQVSSLSSFSLTPSIADFFRKLFTKN